MALSSDIASPSFLAEVAQRGPPTQLNTHHHVLQRVSITSDSLYRYSLYSWRRSIRVRCRKYPQVCPTLSIHLLEFHPDANIFTPSFAFLEGKAFRHGDIVSCLICARRSSSPHTQQEDALGDVAKKAGGFALGALIGKGGSKFSSLDVKRVYFGCVLMFSCGWIAISHRAAVSQELVERLQSGWDHMRSHYFRPSRLIGAHFQAVDVAGLQKLQIQASDYMRFVANVQVPTTLSQTIVNLCMVLGFMVSHSPQLYLARPIRMERI